MQAVDFLRSAPTCVLAGGDPVCSVTFGADISADRSFWRLPDDFEHTKLFVGL